MARGGGDREALKELGGGFNGKKTAILEEAGDEGEGRLDDGIYLDGSPTRSTASSS